MAFLAQTRGNPMGKENVLQLRILIILCSSLLSLIRVYCMQDLILN